MEFKAVYDEYDRCDENTIYFQGEEEELGILLGEAAFQVMKLSCCFWGFQN